METRVCSKCDKEKNLTKDNFKVVKSAKTGKKYFTGYCKICYYEQTNKARRRRKKPKLRKGVSLALEQQRQGIVKV